MAPTAPGNQEGSGATAAEGSTHDGENGTKARILALVHESPSLNIQEIAKALDLARTTVVYHMRQLLREKAVATKRQGHHLLHFPADMPDLEQAALTALRVASLRGVIEAVFFEPHVSRTELEDRLFLTGRTLRRALSRLTTDSLVLVHPHAKQSESFIELNPRLRALLGRHSQLLRPDRPPLRESKGIKVWLCLLPQAWRAMLSPW